MLPFQLKVSLLVCCYQLLLTSSEMDITNVFKACVKMVKTRNKSLGIENESGKLSSDILKKSKDTINGFHSKAKEIVATITKLQVYLNKNRQAYINVDQLWDSPTMDNFERDHIDADAQAFMRTCSHVIKEFKQNYLQQSCSEQNREHRQFVYSIIEHYLKAVCTIYSEQRAIRVKRTIEKQKMTTLELKNKRTKVDTLPLSLPSEESEPKSETEPISSPSKAWNQMEEDEDLLATPEEIQMFEQENQKLYDDLASLADDVRHIEGQVVEISKLQEIFTNKILEQDQSLDHISDTVINTNENIKTANEDIREAMKKNASFRAWILFFLIVMAFSLLFLDWYNP
ncbi:Syntaxin-18 [Chamberlinius hualienensis]